MSLSCMLAHLCCALMAQRVNVSISHARSPILGSHDSACQCLSLACSLTYAVLSWLSVSMSLSRMLAHLCCALMAQRVNVSLSHARSPMLCSHGSACQCLSLACSP